MTTASAVSASHSLCVTWELGKESRLPHAPALKSRIYRHELTHMLPQLLLTALLSSAGASTACCSSQRGGVLCATMKSLPALEQRSKQMYCPDSSSLLRTAVHGQQQARVGLRMAGWLDEMVAGAAGTGPCMLHYVPVHTAYMHACAP